MTVARNDIIALVEVAINLQEAAVDQRIVYTLQGRSRDYSVTIIRKGDKRFITIVVDTDRSLSKLIPILEGHRWPRSVQMTDIDKTYIRLSNDT